MKTTGWILLVIGVLTFLGAALKGNSVFGPLFWLALGAYLIHRANTKEIESKEKTIEIKNNLTAENQISEKKSVVESTQNNITPISTHKPESLDVIQAQLTLQQREAAMCFISFFGGFNDDLMDDRPIVIFKQAATFFGIPNSPMEISKIMSKYTDADSLVDIVLTIKSVKAKEFLLLTCYDLIKTSHTSEAYDLLLGIANDMGYNKIRFEQLVQFYK